MLHSKDLAGTTQEGQKNGAVSEILFETYVIIDPRLRPGKVQTAVTNCS